MSETDQQFRSLIDRILRLKEEQDELAKDVRDIYAEAKGNGYDKTAMGQLVAHLRKVEKVGKDAVDERETVFALYLDAYQRASGTRLATHTHEAVSAKLVETVVKGVQTEIGRKALVAALDVMIEAEEAASPIPPSPKPYPEAQATADALCSPQAPRTGGASATNSNLRPNPSPEADRAGSESPHSLPVLNSNCQKAQRGEKCFLSHSMASCAKCADAAVRARAAAA